MTNLKIADFNDFVMVDGDKIVTDSRRVAKHFGKQHAKVLRDIRRIGEDAGDDFAKANFGFCTEASKTQRGKPQPFYQITKDGFMFLVMGFTGKKAAQIKEAYINAFNWMAAQLFGRPSAAKTSTDARTPLRAAVSMLVGKRSLMYPDAYALVHQRFGVEHIDQLAPEQIGPAVEYVHRLVLEGEVLPAERAKGAAVLLDDTEAFNLAGLLRMLPCFEDVQQKAEEILRAAESPLAAGMFDAWHETALFCGVLESVRDRCNEVKERLSKPLLK